MAKNSRMLFDKTEIICVFEIKEGISKTIKKAALTYNNIQSVSMKPCKERKGLKVVDSERIIIRSNKLLKPIEYYKFKEKDFFEDYKAGLRIFCKDNRITLYDEVE
jgi:hypothetical protein